MPQNGIAKTTECGFLPRENSLYRDALSTGGARESLPNPSAWARYPGDAVT